MAVESRRDRILVSAGVITVAIGASLPWLQTNPTLPSDAEIPAIYYSGMDAGLEAFDVPLLGLVGFVLVLRAVSSRERLQTGFTLLTGAGTVAFCALYLSRSSLVGFTATFVPASGWYLTVLGGASLTLAGGLRSLSIVQGSDTTKSQTE